MKIVTADITGSLIVNGVDVTNNVVSSSVFSGSIAGRVTSLEQFSASLDATFATDASVTASILVLSQSVQASQAALSSSYTATSGSFVATSASFASTSGSIAGRVTLIEGQYATTGSNQFNGSQSVSGSVVVSQSISVPVVNTPRVQNGSQYLAQDTNTQITAIQNGSQTWGFYPGGQFYPAGPIAGSSYGSNELILTDITPAKLKGTLYGAEIIVSNDQTGKYVWSFDATTGNLTAPTASSFLGTASVAITTINAPYYVTTASYNTDSSSLSGRVTIIEGQDATTGSNIFTGTQRITEASNAISFTSTASLYTDGGLRVSKDSYVSGTAYFNNVVVYGTSSIQYITSSQVDIGANIITVNTDTPAVRFGGLAVYDSGSTQLTGSMLWDSEANHWVYSNPSGSTYSGGMIISGPRAASLGTEVGTTSCALMMGQGGDHITSSAIFSYGNATCFYGQSYISGSGDTCFAGSIQSSILCSNTINLSGNNNALACNNTLRFTDTDTATEANQQIGKIEFFSCDSSTPGAGVKAYIGAFAQDTTPDAYLSFATQDGSATPNPVERLRISSEGITCFASTVCAPAFVGGTVCGTSTYFNINSTSNVGFFQGNDGTTTLGNSFNTVHRNANDGNGRYSLSRWQTQNASGLDQSAFIGVQAVAGVSNYNPNLVLGISTGASSYSTYLTIASTGVACFACTTCVPRLQVSNTNSIIVVEGTATNGEGTVTIAGKNSSGTSRSAIFKYDNADIIRIATADAIPMRFETSDVTRLTIASTGVSTFACQICTVAVVTADLRYTGTGYITYDTSASGTSCLIFRQNGTEKMRISECGYVAVTGNEALSCVPYLQGMSFGWNRTNGQGESMINWTNAGGGIACDLTFNFRDSSTLYERVRITAAGIACFACQVCAPYIYVGKNAGGDTTNYSLSINRHGDLSCSHAYTTVPAFTISELSNAGPTSGVVDTNGIWNLSFGRYSHTMACAKFASLMFVGYDGAMGPLRVDGRGNMFIGYDRTAANPSDATFSLLVACGIAAGSYQYCVPPNGGALFSGNVGINTTSPCAKLQVNSSGGDFAAEGTLLITRAAVATGDGSEIRFQYGGNNRAYQTAIRSVVESYGGTDAASLQFLTQPSYNALATRMTITGGGIVTFACQICTPQVVQSQSQGKTLTLIRSVDVNPSTTGYMSIDVDPYVAGTYRLLLDMSAAAYGNSTDGPGVFKVSFGGYYSTAGNGLAGIYVNCMTNGSWAWSRSGNIYCIAVTNTGSQAKFVVGRFDLTWA